MPRPYLTDQAESDLVQIWEYVAADSEENADRLIEGIQAKAQMLADAERVSGTGASAYDRLSDLTDR